ncbi:hypothetical protein [Niabella soli]|uniref:Uncharacterized protein n=1 Tax=Niabella soli DSM 19437 TaxID=929713 RepID=W0F2R9_9BACT|nr:hypothetical protein [Niabella soli]AHF17330.1 hypothetical protein NIASO_05780 [Niabella soli DSM 19437]
MHSPPAPEVSTAGKKIFKVLAMQQQQLSEPVYLDKKDYSF